MTKRIPAAEYRRLRLADWSESEFLTEVVAAAAARGWMCFHPRPAMLKNGRYVTAGQGSVHGFPDLVIARDGVTLLRELKTETGQLTDRQRIWLEATGGKLWRPSMWDEIMAELE